MDLTHSNIFWYHQANHDVEIVDICGEFPNVPLLGIRGGITYNPCLAWREFSYAMRDGHHDTLVIMGDSSLLRFVTPMNGSLIVIRWEN